MTKARKARKITITENRVNDRLVGWHARVAGLPWTWILVVDLNGAPKPAEIVPDPGTDKKPQEITTKLVTRNVELLVERQQSP